MKRFALLLFVATTAFAAEKPDLALMRFMPALPKRLESGCWPARAIVLKLAAEPVGGELDAFDGERRVFHGSATAHLSDARDKLYTLTWPVAAACSGNSAALRLRYRLTLRTRNGNAIVVRPSYEEFPELRDAPAKGRFPPPPPAGPDEFDQTCDLTWAREPKRPVTLAANADVVAYRIDDAAHKGAFHGMRIVAEKTVPPPLAAKIVSVLNDGRTYACSGMACLHVGMAFRVANRDLGICLECRYLHDFASGNRTPLSSQGVKELTAIYNELFR